MMQISLHHVISIGMRLNMLCTCCTSGYSHLYIGSGGVGKIGEFFHSDLTCILGQEVLVKLVNSFIVI